MLPHTLPSQSRGIRRSCPTVRATQRRADSFDSLPDGISRWRLAAALRGAATRLDLNASMLRLLELYIDMTYDIDWTAGSEPVITRPLFEIAEHMGRSERQIRNIERALMERGLLTWRDSGNHHRKGRRDRITGRLIYAYGPSLAPLAARCPDIIEMAAQARQDIAAARRLRLAISALRRRIRATLAETTGHDDIARQFAALPARTYAHEPIENLQGRRDRLADLAEQLDARLSGPAASGTSAGKAEIFRRQHTKTFNKEPMNRRNHLSTDLSTNEKIPERRAEQFSEKLLLSACSEKFRESLPNQLDDRTTLPAIIDNAGYHASQIGIDPELWHHACRILGPVKTSAAIIIIEKRCNPEQETEYGKIHSPSAYLRGMIGRHYANRLNLLNSLHSEVSRNKAAYKISAKETENPARPDTRKLFSRKMGPDPRTFHAFSNTTIS